MEKLTGQKSNRIVELDALRALAAINLLLFHFTYLYQNKHGFSAPLGITYPYGKYGVQLFFMLSGLVNAMTLLSKRQPENFLAARLIRICPPYWAALLLNLVLVCFLPLAAHPPTLGAWLANATIVPGLWGAECIEPVTWTLQVELLFYVILLAIFSVGGFNRPVLMTGIVLAAVLCISLPLKYAWIAGGSSVHVGLIALESAFIVKTLPLFLIGILINELRCGHGRAWQHWAGIVGCAIVFHLVDQRDYNPVITIGFTVLLWLCAFGRVPVLRLKPIVFVSGISYSLYLLHNNLGSTIIFHVDPWLGPWPAIGLATAIVFVIATLSSYYFERPLARWLNRRWTEYQQARVLRIQGSPARLPATGA